MGKANSPCRLLRPHPEIDAELIDQMPLAPTDRSSQRSNGHLSVRLIKRFPRPSQFGRNAPFRLGEPPCQKAIHCSEAKFPRTRRTQLVEKHANRPWYQVQQTYRFVIGSGNRAAE